MNEKKIFESQEAKITSLKNKLEKAQDSIYLLENKIADLTYFNLEDNENALSYLESYGLNPQQVISRITDFIYDQNLQKTDNPLVPYEGVVGLMKINKIKFLNHKWIIADFSDGELWGEMLLEYKIDDKNQLQLNTISSLIYPAN
jgi:hypothetical protein